MKHLLIVIFGSFLFVSSCRKEISKEFESQYIQRVKESVKSRMDDRLFDKVDFSRGIKTRMENENNLMFRAPFYGKDLTSDFMLIETDDLGNCLQGRIVNLTGSVSGSLEYNGKIIIKSLLEEQLVESNITAGHVEAFSRPKNRDALPVQPYIPELPEVIVTGYIPTSGGGLSFSTYLQLMSFFNTSGGSGGYSGSGGYGQPATGAYYGQLSPGGGGAGGGTGGGGGSNTTVEDENAIYVDFEQQYADPAIDIEKYIKCFDAIPDAGSTCRITIFTDIPVNGDPTKIFDWDNGSPGHTFIQFQKSNGSQQVSQNIGFYPVSGWKTAISPAPVEGKFVDNHHHEFNASYEKVITPAQLQNGLLEMVHRKSMRYDIDDNNCTDWAIAVFNATLAGQEYLEIPMYDIPGGEAPYGTSTPQGLFNKLREMQNAGGAQAQGIVVPIIGWVGASSGPCY